MSSSAGFELEAGGYGDDSLGNSTPSSSSPILDKAKFHKLIMKYLLTEGFIETAEKFQLESGGIVIVKVVQAINQGKVQEAVEIINAYQPQLLGDYPYLKYRLLELELIEMIRDKNICGALDFAHENLAKPAVKDIRRLKSLERTMALLAYAKPEKSPFRDLLAPSHRQEVAEAVKHHLLWADSVSATSTTDEEAK